MSKQKYINLMYIACRHLLAKATEDGNQLFSRPCDVFQLRSVETVAYFALMTASGLTISVF